MGHGEVTDGEITQAIGRCSMVCKRGISRYRHPALQLRYAVPDGQALVTTLQEVVAPLVRDVRIVTVFDSQATLAGLSEAFAAVSTQVAPDDIFVFYLAGHGVTLDGQYHSFRRTCRRSVRM